MAHICTPLKPQTWKEGLRGHPDRKFADYIVNGIAKGFRIGFDYHTQLKSSVYSASENPRVIDEYLANEAGLNRITEVPAELHPLIHI